ncbi:formylmethanofuran dehydrogenase subunit B [Candidatus Nitrosacidococcus sp. I8]|uniref:formylmethanofuran dehydrogenase subunit B n=1 Tax=Candidatus Nitrosacidococcus sp. I8 TaxID=2942908 RepID=UPI0022275D77|nr:formylmethanofuran dehydrogenase subunit B [Candidatus Nitrosacidococcus sp. I8]CAH9014007.1 Formyltransferase/hydrolase complex Fhc subunit B [Candidatus Nitrosacidococcus sp. I8]
MILPIGDHLWNEVPNPFDSVGSDNLRIKIHNHQATVLENNSEITKNGFEQELGDSQPKIKGNPASLVEAIDYIISILNQSQLPLLSGLATDVAGIQAALKLAKYYGATVDYAASGLTSIFAIQYNGFIGTTLAEVKNRADLLLVIGGNLESNYLNFLERYIWNNQDSLYSHPIQRKIIYLGCSLEILKEHPPYLPSPLIINYDPRDLPEILATLKAITIGSILQAKTVAGVPVERLCSLVELLKRARYSVVTWAIDQWPISHKELTIQILIEFIGLINHTTRCSVFPFWELPSEISAYQVCTWQTGYPTRISFSSGYSGYDPYLYAAERILNSEEADSLIWISAFDQKFSPPIYSIPTIVLGRSGMNFTQDPEVFIPIGTPGIDHSGHIFCSDHRVIPLYKLRNTNLPSTAEIINTILK